MLTDLYAKYLVNFYKSREFLDIWGDLPQFTLSKNKITAKSLEIKDIVNQNIEDLFLINSFNNIIHDTVINSYYSVIDSFDILKNEITYSNFSFTKSFYFRQDDNFKIYEDPIIKKRCFNHYLNLSKDIYIDEFKCIPIYTLMAQYGSKRNINEFLKISYYVKDNIFHLIHPSRYSVASSEFYDSLHISTVNLSSDNYIYEIDKIVNIVLSKRIFDVFFKKKLERIFKKRINHVNFNKSHNELIEILESIDIKEFSKFIRHSCKFDLLSFDINQDNFIEYFKPYIELYKMSKI